MDGFTQPSFGTVLSAGAASLSVERLCWETLDTRPILDRVQFSLAAGEILAVVGPNGAGKSTLLRLLYRFLKPTAGRILVDGVDITAMPRRSSARMIAAVLQEQPADFALTVNEVVALGRIPHRQGFAALNAGDEDAVASAISIMELDGYGERLLNTLSGGECQRVMMARALAQQPRILVLDEPTNHLDIRHRLKILQLLRTLSLTVVCSLHELNAAMEFADRILVLSHGRMLAFGTSEEVLTADLVSEAFNVRAFDDRLAGCGRRQFDFSL
ncbi:MAG: ABC transporter ATP-binding protein [Rhodobacteraceae bacterium]|nr:ABC transporter ATP-binding protein [Paracoccaceae bacterium]